MIDYKLLLNTITTENVISLMEELGSPVMNHGTTSSGVEYFQFRTICHGGDSDKLYYYTDSKSFYCYTSCGYMSFFDCISRIKNISRDNFYSCLKFVAEFIGFKQPEDSLEGFIHYENDAKEHKSSHDVLKEDWEDTELYESLTQSSLKQLPEYNIEWLDFFKKHLYYYGWLEEGISREVMDKFRIGWEWYGCYIIIPHFDIDGRLIGIRRRTFNKWDLAQGRKYTPMTTLSQTFPHELGQNLYGIYENKSNIEREKEVILVEGEKSVMLLDTYFNGKHPGLATCGFNISKPQLELLVRLNPDRVYLAFDKDFDVRLREEYKKDEVTAYNYNRYIDKLIYVGKQLNTCLAPYGAEVYIILDHAGVAELDEKDSPVDKGPDAFLRLKKLAIKFNKEALEYYKIK